MKRNGPSKRTPWLLVLGFILAAGGWAFYFTTQIQARGWFEYAAIDFRLLYASVRIWQAEGMNAVYDPQIQARWQRPLVQQYAKPHPLSMPFWPLPMPYAPLYVALHAPLGWFSPGRALVLWQIGQVLLLGFYGWLWKRRLGARLNGWLIVLGFLSAPVMLQFFLAGQANTWLMLFLGEAYWQARQGRSWRSGLWLAGGWFKPSLILPLVILTFWTRVPRWWRGWLLGSLGFALLNIGLWGWEPWRRIAHTLRTWPHILRTSGISWGVLQAWLRAYLHWPSPLITGALLFTLTLAALLWLRLWRHARTLTGTLYLGTLLAQSLLTPHMNIHSGLVLLPAWWACIGELPHRQRFQGFLLYNFWVWLPTGLFLVLVGVGRLGHAHDLSGLLTFALHLGLLKLVESCAPTTAP